MGRRKVSPKISWKILQQRKEIHTHYVHLRQPAHGGVKWRHRCTAILYSLFVDNPTETRTATGRFGVPHLLIYNLHSRSHAEYIATCCYETCLLTECSEILDLPISCTHASIHTTARHQNHARSAGTRKSRDTYDSQIRSAGLTAFRLDSQYSIRG